MTSETSGSDLMSCMNSLIWVLILSSSKQMMFEMRSPNYAWNQIMLSAVVRTSD